MQLTVKTPEHGEKGMGWKPDTPDHRDHIFNLERRVEQPDALAEVFSLRDQMPDVYDQGQLGSCVPNGTGALFEHRAAQEGEKAVVPARLFIYYNGRVVEHTVSEDSGLEVRTGIKVIAGQGAPPESDYPYDISKFTEKPSAKLYTEAKKFEAIEYLRVVPGAGGSPVRTALKNGSPISFGFTVPALFEDAGWDPAHDFLPLPKRHEGVLGGHCTDIVGWDFSRKHFPVNVFEIRNSWGPEWGDGGYFYMDARWIYEPSRNLSSDFWIIEKVS